MNQELRVLYEQDQEDRRSSAQFDDEHWQEFLRRDRARRQRVEEILASDTEKARQREGKLTRRREHNKHELSKEQESQ